MMAGRRSLSFWIPPPLRPSQEILAISNSSAPSLSSSPIDLPPKPSEAMLIPNFIHDPPESWSHQLLLEGFLEEEEGCTAYGSINIFNSCHTYQALSASGNGGYERGDGVIKQEDNCGTGGHTGTANNNQYSFVHGKEQAEAQAAAASRSHSWSNNSTAAAAQVAAPGSSPRSCLTTCFGSRSRSSAANNNNSNSSSILDLPKYKSCRQQRNNKHHHGSNHCRSSDKCNSAGAALKKARIQASSAESSLKVRKEKLGDRIAALHQLVSPFGKTDTASVLLEAIACIRFLQAQVEALSSPYLGAGTRKNARQCGGDEDSEGDLRSRGLCLVPVSFTLHVGRDIGADFWTPNNFGVGI